jgi:hemerythrin-like domain-containing protein/glyoxylase-like metal-dependent hydrolase (beta-lactamase superfamily II)
MRAVEVLEEEHAVIEQLLSKLDLWLERWDPLRIEQVLQFFDVYVDRVHHAKERLLCDRLADLGGAAALPVVRRSLTSQAQLRAVLRGARTAFPAARDGDAGQRAELGARLGAFGQELGRHLGARRADLYVYARSHLAPSVDGTLTEGFDRIQRRTVRDADLRRLERMAAQSPNAQTVVVGTTALDDGPTTLAGRPHDLDARSLATDEAGASRVRSAPIGVDLFDRGGHRVRRLPGEAGGSAVEANQYLISDGGVGLVLDPGGPKVYASVLIDARRALGEGGIEYVVLSHQDPDILTSLNAWLIDTEADVYISRLWRRFVPHFGIDHLLEHRLRPIPDDGMRLPLGRTEVVLLPAHFLHSCGNFHVYDPTSKVLFSGDLGGSFASGAEVVRDFDEHLRYMHAFHVRYMASNRAMRAWVKMVRALDVETIAPQHGARFEGREMVGRLLDWLENLRCGVDVLEHLYRVPS